MEAWRDLLYPLGFLASFAFAGRFFLQWWVSEVRKQSVVTRGFWIISVVGTSVMALHALIQLQLHVCLIYAVNCVIAWRNLNLLQPKEKQAKLFSVIGIMALSSFCIVSIFALQGYLFFGGHMVWLRTPTYFWTEAYPQPISLAWHIFGSFGFCLFASRFWIQWWLVEHHQESFLGKSFWWLSLVGALISVLYFSQMRDWVTTIGPGIGLFVYVRNLMLMKGDRSPTIATNQ